MVSNYYEGDAGEAGPQTGVMPPPGYQQPMYPPPHQGYGYGYGMRGFGRGLRPMHSTETKPFFLTSEFGVSVLAAILIAITAASSEAFGAWRAWILITAIVVAYVLSRGIAKAGARSHASDPRDHLDPMHPRHHHADQHNA